MFAKLRSLFQGKPTAADPYEQFVVAFVEECKRQGCKPTSYDHQTRSFIFHDSKGEQLTAFLENNFRLWHQSDAAGRAKQLTRFVRSISEIEQNANIDLATLLAELMPAVRSRALISHRLIDSWIGGSPADTGTEIASTPFCGDLAACVVRDHRDSISSLLRSNLDFVKLSFEEALAHAMAQFRAKAPSPEFVPDQLADGLFYSANLEDYQSSLLLLTPGNDFAFPSLAGDPVVLIPTRNEFFVTGSHNKAALRALLELAEIADQQAHFCSATLLVWRGGRWNEFFFEAGTDEAIRQRQIALRQLTSDYHEQKRLLDQLYSVKNEDIFVAEFMVFRQNDQPGSEFSVATLASGAVGALLPETDRLSFVDQTIDPRTDLAQGDQDIVVLPWPDAMEVARHLFEPVPHLYPPRRRALGFPDHSLWAALRQRAGK